jgi:hypothetical protein
VECTASHGRVSTNEKYSRLLGRGPERTGQVSYGELGSLSAAERLRAGASEVDELGEIGVVEVSCGRVVGVVLMES